MLHKFISILALMLLSIGCDGIEINQKEKVEYPLEKPNVSSKMLVKKKSNSQISNLESVITLPINSYPLKRYERYYIIIGNKFEGAYILNDGVVGSVHLVSRKEKIPYILDGGCELMHIKGDFSDPTSTVIFCNGHA